MRANNYKGIIFLLLLLSLVLLTFGCTNTRNDAADFKTTTAKLTVTTYLNNIITNNSSSALAVEDQLDLSEIEITLINLDNSDLVEEDERDLKDGQTEVSFDFDNLNLDNKYEIKVKVKDDQGHYVYQAKEEVAVTSTLASYSIDELKFLEVKNVIVDLYNLPEKVDTAEVNLETDSTIKYKKKVAVNPEDEIISADFSDQKIEVGQYDLSLSLLAGDKEVFKASEADLVVLPNQLTIIKVDYKQRTEKLGVDVVWEPAPKAPIDFSKSILGSTRVKLSWKQAKQEYNIYRNQKNDFKSAEKLAVGFKGKEYIDAKVKDDLEYYYWIKAIGKRGMSSPLVGPEKAVIPKFSGVKIYYYQDKDTIPTISVSTKEGENIISKMGYDEKKVAKMRVAPMAPEGWYQFKIANKYLPKSKQDLIVEFAKAKEVKLSPVKTAWYNGEKWLYKQPYQE